MAAAETIDVDRLLWTPGEKTIFLPPKPIVYETRVVSLHEWYRISPMNFSVGMEWSDSSWPFTEAQISAAAKSMADYFDKQAVDMIMAMYRDEHEIVGRVEPLGGASLFNPSSLKVRFPRRAA